MNDAPDAQVAIGAARCWTLQRLARPSVVAAVAIRWGAFRRRAVVEVRIEPATLAPAAVNVVVAGRPVSADVRWPDADGRRTTGHSRSVEIDLPSLPIEELRVWALPIGPEGDADPLPALLDVENGDETRRIDLRPTGGQFVLPASGAP